MTLFERIWHFLEQRDPCETCSSELPMNRFAEFLLNLEKALGLLPSDKSRLRVLNLLVAGLSAHVSDEVAQRIMGRALDEAQDFNPPKMQLVHGGK